MTDIQKLDLIIDSINSPFITRICISKSLFKKLKVNFVEGYYRGLKIIYDS